MKYEITVCCIIFEDSEIIIESEDYLKLDEFLICFKNMNSKLFHT